MLRDDLALLHGILAELIACIEAQEPGRRCGILVVTEDGEHFRRGCGPNLPEIYHAVLDGAPISPPYVGACGEAAHRGIPIIGADFAAAVRTMWAASFAGEIITRFRHTLDAGEPYVAKDTVEQRADRGEVEAYNWRIERITMPDGRFGVVCYFYDLSKRHRMEAALRASEARFSSLCSSRRRASYES